MAKPTVKPQFAWDDQVDPTSGKNNVIEPPAAKKQYGWDYKEKPARNWMNWIHRITLNWVDHFDDVVHRAATFYVAADDAGTKSKNAYDYLCDGTADDVQIQAAITAAAAAGGGTVLLSEGEFVIEAEITLADNVNLVGMGKGATVLKIKQNTSASFTVLDLTSCDHTTVAKLGIDSNSQTTYGHVGIELNASTHCRIVDCSFKNIVDNSVANMGNGIWASGSSYHIVITGCDILDCSENGIYLYAINESIIAHNHIESCDTSGMDLNGYHLSVVGNVLKTNAINIKGGANTLEDSEIIGNQIIDSTTDGIDLTGTVNRCSIVGNNVSENDGHGINVDGVDCLIAGNNVYHNSQGGDDTSDGIRIEGDYCTVTNNMVRRGATTQHKYGLNIVAGATGTYIADNDLLTSGKTANYIDSGTSTCWPFGPIGGAGNQKYVADDALGATFSAASIAMTNRTA